VILEALRPLVRAWSDAVDAPRRRASFALCALVLVVALLVARQGTALARIVAVVSLVVLGVSLAVWSHVEAAVMLDPARAIRRLAGRLEPELTARALRALSLQAVAESPGDVAQGASPGLARLHLERSLRALPRERIAQAARDRAFAFGVGALVTVVAALAALAYDAWGIAEGADVLMARDGVAPLGMMWLEEVDVRSRPPDYLHEEERRRVPYLDMAVPYGTLLTVRGVSIHHGRRLALTDGENEVPFVDDGAGGGVARWPVVHPTPLDTSFSMELHVVARFGDVVIPEPLATKVSAIPDVAPKVELEGAPKRVLLAVQADAGDIPLRYEANDDHGLREVHLVLRSGAREERRVLARLDGETRHDRGGHVLRVSDAFLKKSHAPIEVRVEAKDNDPITGPKWGASEAITIVPPDVGEPEANRIDALRKLRDALVDSLAWRLEHADAPREAAARRAFLAEEARGVDRDGEVLETTLSTTYAGVRVAARLQAMLRGSMRKVREAMDRETRGAGPATHAALVKTSERFALVVDGVLHGLGVADARNASRALAEVADDLAAGAAQMQRGGEKDRSEKNRGAARADAAALVLGGGASSMKRMGSLGRDLGEIVDADLLRIARARADTDLPHADLAARDLAARLREPDPSFGARGGSEHAGGESGGGRGVPGEDPEGTSDVEQAFNEAEQDIERLAQEHASGVGRTEQALSHGATEEDVKRLAEESKKHAKAVREATKDMPSIGAGSDSWTSKGAAAREHAEQMARSLEQGKPADAVSSGKSAMQALDEAKRTAQRERWAGFGEPSDADRKIEDAKKRLEPEVRWAEQELDKLRKKAAERAAGDLSHQGDDEEKMAQRAGEVRKKGQGQGALPQPAIESLDAAEQSAREASNALKRGDAERGLQAQREAQRQLERAREALGAKEHEQGGDNDRDTKSKGNDGEDNDLGHADIPTADQHKGPEEFRRRVIKGLGQPASGRQRDAVRRYAEGLLR
jgi:hypothetical protein